MNTLGSREEWPYGAVDLMEVAYSASLDGVCIDVADYIQTALPEWVWESAQRIFVHHGLFAEYKLWASIPTIFSCVEIARPHPNLQERFFAIGDEALISNVIGPTRLIHNLMLLRLLGVERKRVRVIEEQSEFSAEYTHALTTLRPHGAIERVVCCFNSEAIPEIWCETFERVSVLARWSSPLLKASLIEIHNRLTLLVHLTSVYGAQLVPFVDMLHTSFGLQELFVFGACGGLSPAMHLHDTVFVRNVLDETGRVLAAGNALLARVSEYPHGLTGCHRSHVVDVASALCVPAETCHALERLVRIGAAAVDLELGPLARYLSQYPSLRWGAALHVSDRPLMPAEQLGTIPLLGVATQARRNEIFNQAMIAAAPRPPASHPREDAPRLSWTLVSDHHPLTVWETVLESREGQVITVHAVPISLDKLALMPVVNPSGQGYVWQDAIVRGMLPWDGDHMMHMNEFLRRSPRAYLRELDTPTSVIAILNGNGNLFWNLGHCIFVHGKLYHHFREHLCGPQTVLLQDTVGLRLASVNVDALADDVVFAVSGCRIVRRGEPVDLLSIDPETSRPAITEYYGDMTHVLYGFGLSLSLARRVFAEASRPVMWEGQSYYAKAERLSPLLIDAVCGHPITCLLAPDDSADRIRASMQQYRYPEQRWGDRLAPGTFALHKDGVLALVYRRATLGHSVIASTDDPNTLLCVNTYTDPHRKGFTLEDTARVVLRVGASLGHRVEDALVLSSSGDPRILLYHNNDMVCLEKNRHGEPLLFKGGVDYGLSSVLMVMVRP